MAVVVGFSRHQLDTCVPWLVSVLAIVVLGSYRRQWLVSSAILAGDWWRRAGHDECSGPGRGVRSEVGEFDREFVMKLRFTGEWPPQELWARYPNWEYALDEEDLPGQDETTLRPAADQTVVGDEVAFTAGEVEQANGVRLPALIGLQGGTPGSFTAFVSEADGWTVMHLGKPPSWTCIVQDWLPEEERSSHVSLADATVFPVVVRSRLPLAGGQRRLEFRIRPDGTSQSPDQGAR